MAMTLGYETTKLFLGNDIKITNDQYENGFALDGTWVKGTISGGKEGNLLNECDYIDLGIVTNESEQVTIGGIRVPIPFTTNAVTWNIGQRLIRITITGIIPDGIYVGTGSDYANKPYKTAVNGKSNASVFRYKMNRWITLNSFSSGNWVPNIVQYRRKYLTEIDDISKWNERPADSTSHTKLAKWTVSGYSTSFINGTRNLSYTLNLDYSNNNIGLTDSYVKRGINPRSMGDFR
jgi:hypothetical protein